MIFKGGYGRYFARTQVISGGLTFFKSVGWALVSSVMTLAAYYGILLLTRQNEDALPMCFHTSVFGLLYLYTVINTVVVFLVLLMNINFLSEVVPYVTYQAERYDGSGKPEGLKGMSIPFGSRIIAVADAFSALTSDRPQRKAFSVDEALEIIKKETGAKWDPVVVEALYRVVK